MGGRGGTGRDGRHSRRRSLRFKQLIIKHARWTLTVGRRNRDQPVLRDWPSEGADAILRRYSEHQLKITWPPGCPSDIYPTGLWGSDDLRKAQEELKTRRTR